MGVTDMQLMVDSASAAVLEHGVQADHRQGRQGARSSTRSAASRRASTPSCRSSRSTSARSSRLCLSEEGIPPTAEDRFAVAQQLHDLCTGVGLPAEDVWVDPLVLSVSADPTRPRVTMETLKLVKERLPVRTTGGLSNVSFGLPNRAAAQPHLRGHVRRSRPRRADRSTCATSR